MLMRKILLCLAVSVPVCCASAQQKIVFRTPQEAVQYYENLVGRLAQQVRSMQDENAILSASNADLKQRVARLEGDIRSLAGEFSALRKQVAADAEARKDQLNRLADKLTEPARPDRQKTARPESADREPDLMEHVVEKGTTLNALAKAYGVSVRDIMTANKLKKPVIYAGQKLLIPVPKKP